MRLIALISIFTLLSAGALAADCADPDGNEGDFIYNTTYNVPQVCNGTGWEALGMLNPGAGGSGCSNPAQTEGAIFYNSAYHVLQYCDGDDWKAAHGGGGGGGVCTAPASCPNIGDVCADGSLFAGFMLSDAGSCEQIYVTDNNQSISSMWKTSTGTNDINPDDHIDGQANHANRGGTLSDFPAFELCEANSYHGKGDWYLPARAELNLLWLNRAAINANAAGNFTTSGYWSSTEYSTSNAWNQAFGGGAQSAVSKTTSDDVRCIRSEVGGSGSGSGGLNGPSGCPNIGDLCADGTVFAGWHPITQEHLFIPTVDQERPGSPGVFTMNWKNATGTDDINPDSDNDGQINHANRGGAIGDFQAFQACEDLGAGGHGDWYLPTRVELYYIWSIHDTIEAGGNITNFQNDNYWSSTEYSTTNAWNQLFTYGNQSHFSKTFAPRVRCVRRD